MEYLRRKKYCLNTERYISDSGINKLKIKIEGQDTIKKKRGVPVILNILLKSFEYLWFLRFH